MMETIRRLVVALALAGFPACGPISIPDPNPTPPPTPPPPDAHEPVCSPPDLVTGCWHQPPGEGWQFIPPAAPPAQGCSIDGAPGAQLAVQTSLGDELNRAILAVYGCEGGRCVITDGRFVAQRKIVDQLKRQGLCSGQHSPGTGPDDPGTDEIAIALTATSTRESYHVYAGPKEGPGTLVLSPQAAREAWAAPGGAPPPGPDPPPPPVGGCGAPLPPKVWTAATLPDGWSEAQIGTPRWLIECVPHGNVVDCTAKVAPQACDYCAAIGMGTMPDGVQPRCGCPVRKEDSPERGPCEAFLTGGTKLEARNGATCSFAHGNPFQFDPSGGGCRLCSNDGTVCGGWF